MRFRAPDGETEVDQRTINWLLPLFAPTVVYHRIRPQVLVTERVEAPAWFVLELMWPLKITF
jgi:hypothetical protein